MSTLPAMSNQGPRIPAFRETIRVVAELPDAQKRRLGQHVYTHEVKQAEVVRRAIALYIDLVEAQDRGAVIVIREDDGTMVVKTIE